MQPGGVRQTRHQGRCLHHAQHEGERLQPRGVRRTSAEAEGRTLSQARHVFHRLRCPEWCGMPPPIPLEDTMPWLLSWTAITGVGCGEIKLDMHNLQADVRCASSPRLPCLHPSIMAPNFSNDDKEIIVAWIWRSSCMARLGSMNNSNGAS